jgi:predicted MFS family arabinose efflux permease
LNAFAFISAVVIAGFAVIPYLSPYLVSNVGLTEHDLPYVYFFGGGATIFTSRYIGKLSDKYGKQKVFTWIAGSSVIPILLVTNLPRLPVWVALVVTTIFMVLVSGRGVPAMALLTASVEPRQRGSFMSVNFSIQQVSAGLASFGAGLILGKSSTGELTHFGIVGAIALATSIVCVVLSKRIRNVDPTSAGSAPARELSSEST